MKFNRVSVGAVKAQDPRFRDIPKEPGVYRWWFPRDLAEKLLEPLAGVDTKQISKKKIIDGKEYWCPLHATAEYQCFAWVRSNNVCCCC